FSEDEPLSVVIMKNGLKVICGTESGTMLLYSWAFQGLQVGDGNRDHACWERPEDMDTSRTVIEINTNSPGTKVAADSTTTLAAA
nr:endoglucanase 17-like [Tanacetum cinerariifolium]